MPQLGESVDTGTISRWLKAVGDAVAVDEPLYEVSSDKVTMEVPSLAAGFVNEILAQEGEAVSVGAVVARVGAARAEPRANAASGAPEAGNGRTGRRNGSSRREQLSPVVRRLLREHAVDAASLAGSAQGGRITKADVLAHLATLPIGGARPADNMFPEGDTQPAGAARPAAGAARTVPLSRARLLAIERLGVAQKSAVNVFSAIEVDMENVAAERSRRGLTYLPFIARATIDALREHAALNASLDETAKAILYHDAVHLGVAVDLDERGLVVPVVRHGERLTLAALAEEITRVADGARASKLRPDEYAGSTFTITNNGAFGTLLTAPVINAPNVAILSTDAVELRPVVIDRMIAIRHRMYLCMTWDHRAFDGSTAARFLGRVKNSLESWDWSVQ